MSADPQLLDALARCYMRAALDEYMRTQATTNQSTADQGTGISDHDTTSAVPPDVPTLSVPHHTRRRR